jgi:uncharacterized protein YjbI with pentapeptide repeats
MMMGSILEQANFGVVDPGSERFRRGADLSGADMTGARMDGAFNLDDAVTEGAIGLPVRARQGN